MAKKKSGFPIDISKVFTAAGDIEQASKTPVSVSVYIDESAPADVQVYVRSMFNSTAVNSRVSISYFPTMPPDANIPADFAVIAAGENEEIGQITQKLRDAGTPVMVVSVTPAAVNARAEKSGFPIPHGDVVSPRDAKDDTYLTVDTQGEVLGEKDKDILSRRMGQWIAAVRSDKRLALCIAFPFIRKPLCMDSVYATSAENAGIGLVVVVPGADMPLMTLNQAKMILQIAAAYGEPLGMDRVKELAAVVGGGLVCRGIARGIVGIVPVLGWAVKAAIGYSGTYAMGIAAIEYFEGGGDIKGLASVVDEARAKVIEVAATAGSKPSAKAAAHIAADLAGKAATSAGPVAKKVAVSAAGIAKDAAISKIRGN